MQRLRGHTNHYAWGRRGSASRISQLCAADDERFSTREDLPYSELWVGTHPHGPTRLRSSGEELSRYMARRASAASLGADDDDDDALHLPFMMKVMTIEKSLSIQVHPTKAQAAVLHRSDPKNYPDTNHKPELALALTDFELLCGFRPAAQIAQHLRAVPEFAELVGQAKSAEFVAKASKRHDDDVELVGLLREMFTQIMHCESAFAAKLVGRMTARFAASQSDMGIDEPTAALCVQLNEDFAGDVGCFAPLYLNYMRLRPGEACYYAPDELHAYLSGDCVECVSRSNNTIRAALTSKHKDVDVVCDILSYRMTPPSYYMLDAASLDCAGRVVEFAPPIDDFALQQIKLDETQTACTLPPVGAASVLIVVSGAAEVAAAGESAAVDAQLVDKPLQRLSTGHIIYIPERDRPTIVAVDAPFLAFRSFENADIGRATFHLPNAQNGYPNGHA